MTLNAIALEHKIHRFHHQHHHHHYHHVHHLLHHNHSGHNHNHQPVIQEPIQQQHQHHHKLLHNKEQQLVPTSNHVITTHRRHREQYRETISRSRQKSQIQFFLVAAFAYILSPIDLIPEVIFGVFGILDDILFLLMCLFCVAMILIYPIFREMQRTILYKLGIINKKF